VLFTVALALGGTVVAATPALANDAFGTLELSGSGWLGGQGVDVYSNGAYSNVSNTYDYISVNGQSVNVGMEWQCVELAQRLYTVKGWHSGLFPGVNAAADIWASALTMGMSRYSNGSITTIVPGDMIIHGTNDSFSPGYGHVAIADHFSGNTLYAVQQNAPATTTYTLTGGTLSGGSGNDIVGVVHAPANLNASGSPRVITLDAYGNLLVKEGPINAPWVLVKQGVVDYRASSNRIAVLMSDGTLQVKEGPINATWTTVATGVSPGGFTVTNDMVAVLWGNNLDTKVGSLGAPWVLTLNPVASFKVSASDHIAGLMTNGDLEVQWGPVGAGWVDVAGNISGYDITDDMVGVVWSNNLLIKQSSVYATWGNIMNPIVNFAFSSGDHVAANMTNNALNIEWGPVGSGWTGVASGYDAYGITDNRVGILQGGVLSIKEGGVGATWTTVITDITSFALT
jgi:hypothetical protein